MDTEIVG